MGHFSVLLLLSAVLVNVANAKMEAFGKAGSGRDGLYTVLLASNSATLFGTTIVKLSKFNIMIHRVEISYYDGEATFKLKSGGLPKDVVEIEITPITVTGPTTFNVKVFGRWLDVPGEIHSSDIKFIKQKSARTSNPQLEFLHL